MNGEEGRRGGLFQLFRLGVADSPGLHMVAASAGEVVVTPSYLASFSPSLLYPLYHPPPPLVFDICPFLLLPSQVAACLIRVPTEIVKQRRQVEWGIL